MSNNNRHTGRKNDIFFDLPKKPFSYDCLMSLLDNYRSPRDKISLMLKNGEIIRIKKGLYILSPRYGGTADKKIISNLIYGPSYISLEYALSYWGLIPEKAAEVTSVTNKRNKHFRTPLGYFSYRYLNNSRYHFGFQYIEGETGSFFMASKEKAICDKIFFEKTLKSGEIGEYLEENLRIDMEEILDLDIELIEDIENRYRNRSVSAFYLWLRMRRK